MPQLDIKSLPERDIIRKKSLVGNAVTIYGYMALARALYGDGTQPTDFTSLGKLVDIAWFDINAEHWKDTGVVVPSRDRKMGAITGSRVAMSFQTRSAMTDAMLAKLAYRRETSGIAAIPEAAAA